MKLKKVNFLLKLTVDCCLVSGIKTLEGVTKLESVVIRCKYFAIDFLNPVRLQSFSQDDVTKESERRFHEIT